MSQDKGRHEKQMRRSARRTMFDPTKMHELSRPEATLGA